MDQAPAHLVYEGTGLNDYIINTHIVSDATAGSTPGYHLYLKNVEITLRVRMIDATSGDLTGISVDDITSVVEGQVPYDTIEWTLSAQYEGVGASFSLKRGSDTHSTEDTTPVGTGANGEWRKIGYVYYSFNVGKDRDVATEFKNTANSIDIGELRDHNIQVQK